MGNEHKGRSARAFCIAWSIFWFVVWIATTVYSLMNRGPVHTSEFQWFRTGALLAAWAGFFAWKALERPRE